MRVLSSSSKVRSARCSAQLVMRAHRIALWVATAGIRADDPVEAVTRQLEHSMRHAGKPVDTVSREVRQVLETAAHVQRFMELKQHFSEIVMWWCANSENLDGDKICQDRAEAIENSTVMVPLAKEFCDPIRRQSKPYCRYFDNSGPLELYKEAATKIAAHMTERDEWFCAQQQFSRYLYCEHHSLQGRLQSSSSIAETAQVQLELKGMANLREMLDLQAAEVSSAYCGAHGTAMLCLIERFQNSLQDIGDGTAEPPNGDDASAVPPELDPLGPSQTPS